MAYKSTAKKNSAEEMFFLAWTRLSLREMIMLTIDIF